MILRQGANEYAFYWAGQQPPRTMLPASGQLEEAPMGFGSDRQAVLFLRRFADLFSLRKLLSERFAGQFFMLRTEEIYNKLAVEMAKRRLLVLKRWIPAVATVTPAGAATRVPRRQAPERTEPPEPSMFLSNHDSDLQAEALIEAAASGEPFCEECEKARQAAAAANTNTARDPSPEQTSFPPNHDGDAQAATLINAAQNGTPFCEECERAAAA